MPRHPSPIRAGETFSRRSILARRPPTPAFTSVGAYTRERGAGALLTPERPLHAGVTAPATIVTVMVSPSRHHLHGDESSATRGPKTEPTSDGREIHGAWCKAHAAQRRSEQRSFDDDQSLGAPAGRPVGEAETPKWAWLERRSGFDCLTPHQHKQREPGDSPGLSHFAPAGSRTQTGHLHTVVYSPLSYRRCKGQGSNLRPSGFPAARPRVSPSL